jgi:hypothetical protein
LINIVGISTISQVGTTAKLKVTTAHYIPTMAWGSGIFVPKEHSCDRELTRAESRTV